MKPRIMPAMTLWQPWASLVAHGLKPYETRRRPPPHWMVGERMAIHAALRTPGFGEITPEIHAAMGAATGDRLWWEKLPYGAVVCTATLDAALPTADVPSDPFGDYAPHRWAWRLTDVYALSVPAPAQGSRLYGWTWAIPDGLAVYPPAEPRPSGQSGVANER
jgi:hypothetical protein